MRLQILARVVPLCLLATLAWGCNRNESTPSEGPELATREEPAAAGEVKVMISGGLTAAYNELSEQMEQAIGRELVTSYGASMGTAPDAIPVRLERGEAADVLIMVGDALDGLIEQGKVRPDSRVDIALSKVGVATRAGAPRPDISTEAALRRTLLEAESIAYSASASGRYVSGELFPRLGIAEQVAAKSTKILSERVGTVVARGDAEIGFQQISELLPIEGIDFLGPLPPELQKITTFSGGILIDAADPQGAEALLAYFTSSAAADGIERSGLEPVGSSPQPDP